METTINERIADLIKGLNMNNNSFAKSLGKAPSNILSITEGKTKPGFDLLEVVATTYPKVNTDWLIKGEGSMFRVEASSAPLTDNGRGDDYLMQHLANLQEANKLLARTVEAQSAQITTLLGKSRVVSIGRFRHLFFTKRVQKQVQPISDRR